MEATRFSVPRFLNSTLPRCRGWRPWPGSHNRKGSHSWFSSVRSVEAAKSSSEVVVPKADALVGARLSLDRLDHLLHQHHYQKFCCCFVASADPFRAVVCPHVPTVAGSVLETQSVQPQASLFPVGTLVPLPALWHFNGAGILALRNRQPGQIPNRSPCDGFDLPWSLEVEVARTKGIRSEQIASVCGNRDCGLPRSNSAGSQAWSNSTCSIRARMHKFNLSGDSRYTSRCLEELWGIPVSLTGDLQTN